MAVQRAPEREVSSAVRRIALLLEYDGTPYAGSQLQNNGPSVQAELEQTIAAMTRCFSRVAFAGRTDAGVHAEGQVVAFDTTTGYGCEEFMGGLNVRLPETICVRAAREVAPAFDPRRHACARRYRYSIVNSSTRSPLERERAWQIAGPLDPDAMQTAAISLAGEHDFAAFAPSSQARLGTRRQMHRVSIGTRDRMIEIRLTANAFLMHQVRRTVAALVDVGSGRLSGSEFDRYLHEAHPGSWHRTAPARGLCLESVIYDPALFIDQKAEAACRNSSRSATCGRRTGVLSTV